MRLVYMLLLTACARGQEQGFNPLNSPGLTITPDPLHPERGEDACTDVTLTLEGTGDVVSLYWDPTVGSNQDLDVTGIEGMHVEGTLTLTLPFCPQGPDPVVGTLYVDLDTGETIEIAVSETDAE